MNSKKNYFTDSLTEYKRLITQAVRIGKLSIGNGLPIRVQSMTTTDTMDTDATVEQIKLLVDSGCEIVRITTPSKKSAENLANIKNKIIQLNYDVPLVADVHFNPNAAIAAAQVVEKVRINPGNFVDRKVFAQIEYSDSDYQEELKKIEDKFTPLIDLCKKHQTTLRIGANHGSLSDRIVNRFGDNPEGMVESALEFLDVCERQDFNQIVFSMKSSNTMVMVTAYRLLVRKLKNRGRIYPLHLGVTEAGDGEDGRIKSAVGIGSLLSDGIGDTVRVSLTEDPEKEIPVAKKIVDYFNHLNYYTPSTEATTIGKVFDPYDFKRYPSKALHNIGGGSVPKVLVGKDKVTNQQDMNQIGYKIITDTDKWIASDIATDMVYLKEETKLSKEFSYVGVKTVLSHSSNSANFSNENKIYPLINFNDLDTFDNKEDLKQLNHYFLKTCLNDLDKIEALVKNETHLLNNSVLIINNSTENEKSYHPLMEIREFILKLRYLGLEQPIIYKFDHQRLTNSDTKTGEESRQIELACMAGGLLLDGLLDGLFLDAIQPKDLSFLFSILQATRQRISRTEYISCPSCGRTLFNLQEVTAKIKAETNHLKGVKIAVMGCIVNGPGEMADAHFGYVGSGTGKISLYQGKEIMKKNIPSKEAVGELIELIKEAGAWQDKPKS